jgi:hypothetical protein
MVEVTMIALNCQLLRVLMRREAAAGSHTLTSLGQVRFRLLESRKHTWPHSFLLLPNSFTGMFYCRSQRRDTAYLFLLCYVIQDRPLHRSWSAL